MTVDAPLTPAQAVLLVAGREFRTQVRSRSFVISLIVTLVLFGGIGLLITIIAGQTSSHSIGLTTATAGLRADLEQAATAQDTALEFRTVDDAGGRAALAADDLDTLLTGEPGAYQLVARDTVDPSVQSVVTAAVQSNTLATALRGAGIDPAQVAAKARVTTSTVEPVDPHRGEQLALAIVGTVLLFFSISGYGQLVASGVVEEKQSRVVELLLATIKPWQLLGGKILGLGGVGLLQLVILGVIGVAGGAVTGLLTVPSAAASLFAMVIVWYLLGFFLFAALYAAVGSTVSRQEELSTLIAPMIMVLVIPFVLAVNLLPRDPRNGFAAVLSFIPFFSQTVMPARYALGVASLWEVALAALLELVAIVVVVRLAGRIYQNSILRTGARVSLREALRG
ncbi:ABC transporter permease [Pseudonocardia sp. GCM10023141]|uniref:ABC transporter permease n=1 Tax=Pseudonocardia sp. GCM10023141 TaxID=3252653 RepID=UPI0036093CFD